MARRGIVGRDEEAEQECVDEHKTYRHDTANPAKAAPNVVFLLILSGILHAWDRQTTDAFPEPEWPREEAEGRESQRVADERYRG